MFLKNTKTFVICSFLFLCLIILGSNGCIDKSTIANYDTNQEIQKILKVSQRFSAAYMKQDIKEVAACYTFDAVLFPTKEHVIEGLDSIKKFWTIPDTSRVLDHRLLSTHIEISDNMASDYGSYVGRIQINDSITEPFRGKYVIVWRKNSAGKWKMYLDIWNPLPQEDE
ncbi:MAG: YybH family protein [Chitinophagales bacterium]